MEFVSRSHTIIHYKRQHAKKAILCDLCNKPIAAHSANTFILHYQRLHPFKRLPYGLDDGGTHAVDDQVP